MSRSHGFLVFLAVATLIAAGGLATLSTNSPEPAKAEVTFVPPSPGDDPSGAACDASPQPFQATGPDMVPPDCCTTQCTVDRDCNKICGKGNCACVQVTSCCRRCVY